MKPLRILWTLPYLPWPTCTGGRTRQYALLRQMAMRGHRITLLCLTKDSPDWDGLADLRSTLEDLIVIRRRSRKSLITLFHVASALRRPAIAAVNGCNSAYAKVFERLLKQDFDVVQVEHSYAYEPFSRALSKRKTHFLLTEHNVESRLVAQQYKRFPPVLRQLATLDELRSRAWEGDVITRASCVIAVTEEDRAAFSRLGARSTALVPNCIDTEVFGHVSPHSAARRLLFVGNYEYEPNVDAVRRLCDTILPSVWRSFPDATLFICGHAMPCKWRSRWPDGRLNFAGYVEKLPLIHAASSLFVAPLRHGGGSKLKVLEAMASALPVIGTSESVSGLGVRADEQYFLAESDDDLARAIITALSNPAKASEIGGRGRQYVVEHHDWAVGANALEDTYARYLAYKDVCQSEKSYDRTGPHR